MCKIKAKQLPPRLLHQMIPQNLSSHVQLKDDCSHVINEIQPQGSNQPQVIPANQKGTAVEKEKFPPRVESMDFRLCFFYKLS
jgi:hypothetical protein